MPVMTKITKSEFHGNRGLGMKQGMYYPVQMLRFQDGLLALMVSIERDEWFVMSQDVRENFFRVTHVFQSQGMSSRVFDELCEGLTARERGQLAYDLSEPGKIKDDDARYEAFAKLCRLELCDDDFPEKEQYRHLASKVSSEEAW